MTGEVRFPDISDMLVRWGLAYEDRPELTFFEKLDMLDRLRETANAFKAARPPEEGTRVLPGSEGD